MADQNVQGDLDGVTLAQALDTGGARLHDWIVSATSGSTPPGKALLWYPPGPAALDKIAGPYALTYADVGYTPYGTSNPNDDFLYQVVMKLRSDYTAVLGEDFGSAFLDESFGLVGTTWYGPAVTWPTDPVNQEWIQFWRALDTEIDGRLGMAGLGDDFWGTFANGSSVGNEIVSATRVTESFTYQPYDPEREDARGQRRRRRRRDRAVARRFQRRRAATGVPRGAFDVTNADLGG